MNVQKERKTAVEEKGPTIPQDLVIAVKPFTVLPRQLQTGSSFYNFAQIAAPNMYLFFTALDEAVAGNCNQDSTAREEIRETSPLAEVVPRAAVAGSYIYTYNDYGHSKPFNLLSIQ